MGIQIAQACRMDEQNDSTIVGAAKAIGKAAGKLAKLTGAVSHETEPHTSRPRQAKGKLPKKNKARLPRRQKKARKKSPQAA